MLVFPSILTQYLEEQFSRLESWAVAKRADPGMELVVPPMELDGSPSVSLWISPAGSQKWCLRLQSPLALPNEEAGFQRMKVQLGSRFGEVLSPEDLFCNRSWAICPHLVVAFGYKETSFIVLSFTWLLVLLHPKAVITLATPDNVTELSCAWENLIFPLVEADRQCCFLKALGGTMLDLQSGRCHRGERTAGGKKVP